MSEANSASQWGSPLATRRALLIHGLTSNSNSWENLAQLLVAEGFFVVAPNLLGHGWRQGSDFRMSALAEDLLPYFAMDTSYDVIIGHSLGGAVTVTLFPFLPRTKETTVILLDPVLEVPADEIEKDEKEILYGVECLKTADDWMAMNPSWSRHDCVLTAQAISACTSAVVRNVILHNKPWFFSAPLKDIPPNLKVTVLVADPKLCTYCRVEHFPCDIERLDVNVLTGIGHCIQFECLDAIMDAIPQPNP